MKDFSVPRTFRATDKSTHLCEHCFGTYPECELPGDDLEFGNGLGEDNIVGCPNFDSFDGFSDLKHEPLKPETV